MHICGHTQLSKHLEHVTCTINWCMLKHHPLTTDTRKNLLEVSGWTEMYQLRTLSWHEIYSFYSCTSLRHSGLKWSLCALKVKQGGFDWLEQAMDKNEAKKHAFALLSVFALFFSPPIPLISFILYLYHFINQLHDSIVSKMHHTNR